MKNFLEKGFCPGCRRGSCKHGGACMLRIVIGLIIAAHGAQKLFGWFDGPGIDGMAGFLSQMFGGSGVALAYAAALVEFVGGLALALGLWTRLAALLIGIEMLVIIFKVHWANGFFVQNGGIEYPLVLLFIMLHFMHEGAGCCSLDTKGKAGGKMACGCADGKCQCGPGGKK